MAYIDKRLYWMQQKEALAIQKSQRPPHRFTILLFIPTKLVIHYCTVFLTSLFNQVIRVAYKRTETILTRRNYKLGGEGKNDASHDICRLDGICPSVNSNGCRTTHW